MEAIDLERVNHFLLRKQHLTENTKTDDILQIVSDIGGLHATGATTPYVSLFARMKSFEKEDLRRELQDKRTLGRIRTVRRTLYVLTKEMIPIAHSATRKFIELRARDFEKHLGITPAIYKNTSKKILEVLDNDGLTAKEVKRALGMDLNISSIMNLMCDQGILIRGLPKKGWKSNIHRYYNFSRFLPDVDLNEVGEEKATGLLVHQYLKSFGPATEKDIVWWTGLRKTPIRKALDDIQEQLLHIEIEGLEGNFVMLGSDEKALKTTRVAQKKTVCFLPASDPHLMGYRERGRYLDYEHYNELFDPSGNATFMILLDGRAVGVWDLEKGKKPLVKLYLLEKVDSSLSKTLRRKAKDIGKFIAEKDVRTKECDSMIPLTERTMGSFMTPLKFS
ncbi:MAG: winged helix DNA-binding domain-containing protein [Methanomassiliicoccales archaeon]|nr:MAG: winged helix DNA-binding domain-containing protein [Methanomassiliicoccales archaeon]